MAKMNSTSLYITTSQIILKSDPNNPSTWQDLYRLAPYLRNSLCCVVCGNLLTDPLTPAGGKCQHHICRKCKGGRKKIKPACVWCKECKTYMDNKTLRILLQCYKKMCVMLTQSGIFQRLLQLATQDSDFGASNLIMLIKEGASFEDDYQINVGLSKSLYSILPCVYTNSSTQTLQFNHNEKNRSVLLNSTIQKVTDREALYSITYAGSGNKITIKRKSKETASEQKNHIPIKKDNLNKAIFKKPTNKCMLKSRHGCRCGNATATPGKLTCCGQRCPCYVESKACLDCKCRGCRNPHRPDGNKIRPHMSQVEQLASIPTLGNSDRKINIPTLGNLDRKINIPTLGNLDRKISIPTLGNLDRKISIPTLPNLDRKISIPTLGNSDRKIQITNVEIDRKMTMERFNEHLMVANIKVLEPFKKIPTSLPHAILVSDMSEDEEITVDV